MIRAFEENVTNRIEGFIGLTDNYIAGLFVKEDVQSMGIGKQLLNYVKGIKSDMRLNVYNKNVRAIKFYQREQFMIQSENIDNNTGEKRVDYGLESIDDFELQWGTSNGQKKR